MFGVSKFNNWGNEFEEFHAMVDDFFKSSNSKLPKNSFRVNVKETETEYIVEVELAGVKKEEINVDFKMNNLLISVDRTVENIEEEDKYMHKEIVTNNMYRSIYLRDADENKIKAKLENGILRITAEKVVETKSSIEIE